jgi:hypothetical protein
MPQDAGEDGADWQSCLLIVGTRDVRKDKSLNVAGAPSRDQLLPRIKLKLY